MSDKINAYQLPEMSCPGCQTTIDSAAPITNGKPRGFKKGSIVVCAHCSAVLRMGDSSFSRMTNDDIKILDPVSQGVISKAVISVRQRIDTSNN